MASMDRSRRRSETASMSSTTSSSSSASAWMSSRSKGVTKVWSRRWRISLVSWSPRRSQSTTLLCWASRSSKSFTMLLSRRVHSAVFIADWLKSAKNRSSDGNSRNRSRTALFLVGAGGQVADVGGHVDRMVAEALVEAGDQSHLDDHRHAELPRGDLGREADAEVVELVILVVEAVMGAGIPIGVGVGGPVPHLDGDSAHLIHQPPHTGGELGGEAACRALGDVLGQVGAAL